MMHNAKPYADYLSLGIWLGLCTAQDAIAWADSQAEQYSTLPDWIIDLATCAGKHQLDVLGDLAQVPGSADLSISHRLLIARLGQRYPEPLTLEDSQAIARYHQLIWKLYEQLEDEGAPVLEQLLLQIDAILDWIDVVPQQESGPDWIKLRQAHHELLAWGTKAAHDSSADEPDR